MKNFNLEYWPKIENRQNGQKIEFSEKWAKIIRNPDYAWREIGLIFEENKNGKKG